MPPETTPISLEQLRDRVDIASREFNAEHNRLFFVRQSKQARKDLDSVIQAIRVYSDDRLGGSDERNAVIHYITNAIMWLGMDLKRLGELNPYPQSMNTASPRVEPTAAGLKL